MYHVKTTTDFFVAERAIGNVLIPSTGEEVRRNYYEKTYFPQAGGRQVTIEDNGAVTVAPFLEYGQTGPSRPAGNIVSVEFIEEE